jgi:hypothetical protein
VARRQGAKVAYELCWQGALENLEALTLAILLEHLGDAEQARKVCAGFVQLMAARISGRSERARSSRRSRRCGDAGLDRQFT